jgi:ribosomal protein S18 acetylase RimI-like enzyme
MEKNKITFRTDVRPEDMENVKEIVESTGFFYDFEIPVAVELVEARLLEGEASGYEFIFAEVDGKTVAYSCFGPIALTQGGYDLFWIVTHNDSRGMGIGKLLLEETHKAVKVMGGRYLVAETSSLEKYAPTRHFYISNKYSKEAEIADFYKVGDGKVIYIKRL